MQGSKLLFIIKGGSEWMGGQYYIKNLIKSVRFLGNRLNLDFTIDLLVYTEDQKKLFEDVNADVSTIWVSDNHFANNTLVNRIRWWVKRRFFKIFNPRLDEFIIEGRYDFVYPAMPRNNFKRYRFAEWIPDFQYRHFPEGSNPVEAAALNKHFEFICKNAPLIYVSSDHARKDCEELFLTATGKLEVMKFCVFTDTILFAQPLQVVLKKYAIPSKFFVVSNLLAPTKNLQVLIDAIAYLKQEGLSLTVVVTGDIHDYRNPGFKNDVFQNISQKNVRDNIILLGLINRMEQKQLLVNSVAIIQPSRFEGWNTLVEEAKCLDKMIVLSNIPVHLEQNPHKSVFFKDNDYKDLAEKLKSLYHSTTEETSVNGITISENYKKNINEFAEHFINVSLQQTN
jgi:glycosyltransferase involved in cell wall biosynthesis